MEVVVVLIKIAYKFQLDQVLRWGNLESLPLRHLRVTSSSLMNRFKINNN